MTQPIKHEWNERLPPDVQAFRNLMPKWFTMVYDPDQAMWRIRLTADDPSSSFCKNESVHLYVESIVIAPQSVEEMQLIYGNMREELARKVGRRVLSIMGI